MKKKLTLPRSRLRIKVISVHFDLLEMPLHFALSESKIVAKENWNYHSSLSQERRHGKEITAN